MTEEKQRIAIAEFCPFVKPYGKGEMLWKTAGGRNIYFDPLNDKNAMQQAKMILNYHDRQIFKRMLRYVLMDDPNNRDNAPEFATAAQEAKALLLALGKWEES